MKQSEFQVTILNSNNFYTIIWFQVINGNSYLILISILFINDVSIKV